MAKEPAVDDRQKLVMSSVRNLFGAKTVEGPYSEDSSYYVLHSTKDNGDRHVVSLSSFFVKKEANV